MFHGWCWEKNSNPKNSWSLALCSMPWHHLRNQGTFCISVKDDMMVACYGWLEIVVKPCSMVGPLWSEYCFKHKWRCNHETFVELSIEHVWKDPSNRSLRNQPSRLVFFAIEHRIHQECGPTNMWILRDNKSGWYNSHSLRKKDLIQDLSSASKTQAGHWSLWWNITIWKKDLL